MSCSFVQEHKVLLTGTPLQNSVEELFSLLNFLEPSQFPSETAFLEEFGDLKTEEQVSRGLKDYILCCLPWPPKQAQVTWRKKVVVFLKIHF